MSDILLQTAFFGIDTTARLSRPTLDLAANTLLPRVILPLFVELFEHYVPSRLRTWAKVGPTSVRNLWNLLRETDAGRSLGGRVVRLGEDLADAAGSEIGRQCVVDATVATIRLLESLRTPEVKALLDQWAVGTCRLVDALASGKAKQVYFDVAEALWALVEVGSDEATVASLAEGCAQVCFALENERESLLMRRRRRRRRMRRRREGEPPSSLPDAAASRRRRERDRRQMGTYPPGRAVVDDAAGRDGFGEALRDGLDGPSCNIREKETRGGGSFEEDPVYADMDNVPVHDDHDDGPPRRVIVTTNSSELRGGADSSFPNMVDVDDDDDDGGAANPNIRSDDSESEITTEMEDLRRGVEEGPDVVRDDDARTKGSAGELPTENRGMGNAIRYEDDSEADDDDSIRSGRIIDRPDWHPDDDDRTVAASEMHDAFDESILQFYRRMNEVLVESRKRGAFNLQYSARGGKPSKVDKGSGNDEIATSVAARDPSTALSPSFSRGGYGIRKSWWRLIIIATLCVVAMMSVLWFALGCYGFYVLVLGGGHVYRPLPSPNEMRESSNIVIQIVTTPSSQDATDECDVTDGRGRFVDHNRLAASITSDDWNAMKLGVDRALGGQQ